MTNDCGRKKNGNSKYQSNVLTDQIIIENNNNNAHS